jgi:hypothetical protein
VPPRSPLQRGLLVVGERLLTVRQLRRSGQPLERPDPDVVTAVNRSAGLLREGRELLLDLVGRAAVRDAAAALTGRGRLRHRRTDRVVVDALLIRPDGCVSGRINGRLRFARYELRQISDVARM